MCLLSGLHVLLCRFTTWLHSCLKSPSLLELTTGDGGEGGDGGEEGEDILELMAEEDMVSDKGVCVTLL